MQNNSSTFLLRFQKFGTVVVLILVLLISACKKDSLIKTGVQPQEDNLSISQIDTFTIYASSYKLDSVRTDGVSSGVIGYSEDDIFGKSVASFIAQIKPSEIPVEFDNINEVVIDSVIFSIQPETCHGDLSKVSSFSIYELEENLSLEENYYSFETLNTSSLPLSSVSYNSILYIDSAERYQTIDFKLDSAYGVALLQQVNTSTDKDIFWESFKGFVFSPNDSEFEGNLMVLLDIYNSQSKLTVYFRQNSSETNTEQYDFIIDNQCERINLYNNDYSQGTLSTSFDSELVGEETLYLQDMSGIGINISIPHITNLFSGDAVIVNKAELHIPVKTNVEFNLPQHSEITLGAYSQDSVLLNTIDGIEETHFNGSIQDDEFIFNITRDIQLIYDEYLKGNDVNYGYSLLSLSPEQNSNGSVFWGTNPLNSDKKMEFVLTYSLAK